jgi:hypothetical protein
MPDALREVLTRRRIGGAALVLAGLAVAAVVLWPVAFGGDEPDHAPKPPAARIVSIPALGLAFAHPRTWTRVIKGRVVILRSPDDSAVITVSSPVGGRRPKAVKAVLLRALRARYENPTVVREGPGRLGTREADTVEILGRGAKGYERALAIVDSTPFRTYAVTVLTPARPSARRLAETAQILATVRLSKPVASKR